MTTPQAPIGSGFGFTSTASGILKGVDLSGRVAIVTGGSAGLGLETTRALSAAGAEVVVPARNIAKAEAVLKGLSGVEVAPMELADPASVDRFAGTFLASGRPLHILVNSAGIMACPFERDARGHELQFATNHLGHFQLASRLWPALCRAGSARVVALSSLGHRYAPVDFDDPHFERRPYDRWLAYGQSKTANALFALHLDVLGAPHGVRAFSVHPGRIITDLAKHLSWDELRRMGGIDEEGRPVIDPARNMKSPEQGAATSVWCAVSPQLDGMGGVYCEDCDIARAVEADGTEPRAATVSSGVRPWARDPEAAERLWRLWRLSEGLTGVRLDL